MNQPALALGLQDPCSVGSVFEVQYEVYEGAHAALFVLPVRLLAVSLFADF